MTIRSVDAGCPRLTRALGLLGTYYNLYVVLSLPPLEGGSGKKPLDKEENEVVQRLRDALRGGHGKEPRDHEEEEDGILPLEVLPDHRIVASRSVTGRVAFVRQMHRAGFVLDHSEEIRTQLGRFGFTVLLYDAEGGGNSDRNDEGVSNLGRTLLSS